MYLWLPILTSFLLGYLFVKFQGPRQVKTPGIPTGGLVGQVLKQLPMQEISVGARRLRWWVSPRKSYMKGITTRLLAYIGALCNFLLIFPIFFKGEHCAFFFKGGIKAGTWKLFYSFKCAAPECPRYGCSSKNDCNILYPNSCFSR